MPIQISIIILLTYLCFIFIQRKTIGNWIKSKPFDIKVVIAFLFISTLSVFVFELLNSQAKIWGGFYKYVILFTLIFIQLFLSIILIEKKRIKYIFGKVSQNLAFWIGMFVSCSAAFFLSLLLSIKTFPIAEGWYSVYAKYINMGKIPYVDFDFLFMPLYAYFIAFVTRIFGYDLIVLRILGVFIFTAISAITYKIFTKLFNPWIAAIAAIASVFYLQSEVVQVFYDYIRVFDLLTYASLLMLLVHIDKHYSYREQADQKLYSVPAILSGLFASCAVLIRQNSGAFIVVYGMLLLGYLIVFSKNKKRNTFYLAQFGISVLIPFILMVVFLVFTGSLGAFLNSTIKSAIGSKGGILTVLFAWIPRWYDSILPFYNYFLLFSFALGVSYILYHRFRSTQVKQERSDFVILLTFLTSIVLGVVLCYKNVRLSYVFQTLSFNGLPNIFFAIHILLFLFMFVRLSLIDKQDQMSHRWNLKLFTLTGMIIAIGYGSGTSGGLSEGQTALSVGSIFGLMLLFSHNKYGIMTKVLVLFMTVSMSLSIVSSKLIVPYRWWNLTETDYRNAHEQIDVPLMQNILVSADTKKGIESIVDVINKHTQPGDSIFAFPHIPIFYLLTDRYPVTHTLVQWFDVANDSEVLQDIVRLKADLPKVIIHVRLEELIIKSHELAFRGTAIKSGLRQMSTALDAIEKRNKYILGESIMIQNYRVDVYYLED